MILIETVLGNASDSQWKARLSTALVEWVVLDHWEAQKNRFRKMASMGTEVAVSLERGVSLHDGDILAWNEEERKAIVARISLQEVMVITIDTTLPTEAMVSTCIELGHAIGNQHWPAVVKGSKVYVPLSVDKKVMSSVMKTHAIHGASYEFVPGSEVIPYLSPHEQRRLFGSLQKQMHSHL